MENDRQARDGVGDDATGRLRGGRRRRGDRIPGVAAARRSARNFTRRSELKLVAALKAQVRATREAVVIARSAVSGEVSSAVARSRVGAIEHEGDRRRAELIATLAGTFASPIDREDLFRTSRSIDDVLDNLRDFVREHDLFELGPQPLLLDVLDAVADGVDELYSAASTISEDPRRMRAASLAARKSDIRVRYQLAMADLLSGDVTAQMLRCRELLRRLDVIGLRLGEAADALADGAVKRNH